MVVSWHLPAPLQEPNLAGSLVCPGLGKEALSFCQKEGAVFFFWAIAIQLCFVSLLGHGKGWWESNPNPSEGPAILAEAS